MVQKLVSGESKNAGTKEIHKFSFYGNDTQDAFDIVLNKNTTTAQDKCIVDLWELLQNMMVLIYFNSP